MKRDLTNKVTVFVTTIGAPTFSACLYALQQQSCSFSGPVIVDHIAPISAAFQVALDKCTTPYFMQVDEDMILDDNAIERLYDAIDKAKPNVALLAKPLHDVHMDLDIIGIKIFRHEVCVRYPYRDVQSCEMDQVKRMEADGFEVVVITSKPLGKHGTQYTALQAYERYADLGYKSRCLPWFTWLAPQLRKLFDRSVKAGARESDLWSLMGYAAGMATQVVECGEKNYRTLNAAPGWREIDARMPSTQPYELTCYVTSRCQLKCKMCAQARQGGVRHDIPDLTTQIASWVLARYPTIKAVCLAGLGEPLLSPHIEDLMEMCSTRELTHSVITNGIFVKSMIDEGFSFRSLTYMNVSINAPSRELYRSITGVDAFETVLLGVKEVREHCLVQLSAVIGRDNIEFIPSLLDLTASFQNGRHEVTLALVNVLPHVPEFYEKQVLRSRDSEAVEMLMWAQQRAEQLGVSVTAWPVLRPDVLPATPNCRLPWDGFTLDGAGHIGGCRCLKAPWETEEDYGEDLWLGPAMVAARRRANGADPVTYCTECFRGWGVNELWAKIREMNNE